MVERKIIQIAVSADEVLYALCDDGTVWYLAVSGWVLEKSIPQGDLKHE